MKNTKTAIKELTVMYRKVLLKCLAIAMGVIISTTANAADLTPPSSIASTIQPNVEGKSLETDINVLVAGYQQNKKKLTEQQVALNQEANETQLMNQMLGIKADAVFVEGNPTGSATLTPTQLANTNGNLKTQTVTYITTNQSNALEQKTVKNVVDINGSFASLDDAIGNLDTVNSSNTAINNAAKTNVATALSVAGNEIANLDKKISSEAGARADGDNAVRKEFAEADKALDGKITAEANERTAADKKHTEDIAKNAKDIADNNAAITLLNGDETVEGSVKNTVKNTAENAKYTGTTVASKTRASGDTTIGTALSATTEQVNTNTADIEANRQNIAKNTAEINTVRGELSETKKNYDARFASLDNKIEDLENDMKKGLASNAALASLVPMSSEHKTQISMGMGGYKDQQGVALGAFHYAKDNVLLNAGAAYSGGDSYSYKAGVTFGF